MDLTVIRELFECVLEGCAVLGDADGAVGEIRRALDRLERPKIGADGRMLEYGIEAEEVEPTHRHLSHLYGVHPGWMFTPQRNREYYEACRKSLEARGDKSTGWAMGWRVALWARFGDGERALDVIGNLLTYIAADAAGGFHSGGGLYANLWDAHPPFQIDGNLGVTAGIAEMLVQSHAGCIHLLPALPAAWDSGSVSGIRARGGFEVDIHWKDGALAHAIIRGVTNESDAVACRYKDGLIDMRVPRGGALTLTPDDFAVTR